MAAVNTTKVSGRRKLAFPSLDAIAHDIEQLARAREVRTLGNWSAGQNLAHVALVMTSSIDGFPAQMPAIFRFLLRTFMKQRILTGPMTPGFKPPRRVKIVPETATLAEGITNMRTAIARLRAETRRAPSPILGPLTVDEWNALHCRHAELHLSFLVPVE